MVYEDMKRLTKPFRPFRITTTSGESFDVWQREGFLLANWHIVVGLLKPGTDEYERTVHVDFGHMAHLEYLPEPVASAKGNGQTGG